MSEDWDNLIILDACRLDIFRQLNDIPGRLSHRLSNGSNTAEFLEHNFSGTNYYDTVYVTGNPIHRVEEWCSIDLDQVFHSVVDVWVDDWDPSVNTVRPAPMAQAVRQALRRYPKKRIIAHFIQPHQPFIGDIGERIDERGMIGRAKYFHQGYTSKKRIWDQLRAGEVSRELVWDAYRENLRIVLPHVKSLCDDIRGKTVITSDHGNLLGEVAWPVPIRKYGHPRGVYTTKLIKVPWLELPGHDRREVVDGRPTEVGPDRDGEPARERLRDLGYVDD